MRASVIASVENVPNILHVPRGHVSKVLIGIAALGVRRDNSHAKEAHSSRELLMRSPDPQSHVAPRGPLPQGMPLSMPCRSRPASGALNTCAALLSRSRAAYTRQCCGVALRLLPTHANTYCEVERSPSSSSYFEIVRDRTRSDPTRLRPKLIESKMTYSLMG